MDNPSPLLPLRNTSLKISPMDLILDMKMTLPGHMVKFLLRHRFIHIQSDGCRRTSKDSACGGAQN